MDNGFSDTQVSQSDPKKTARAPNLTPTSERASESNVNVKLG